MGKGGPPGNKKGTKLKSPDHRQEAYQQYCAHISKGLDKRSWKYVHATDKTKSLTYQTMERYIDENPTEFDTILIEQAKCDSYAYFEQEGLKLMKGIYRNGSPVTWQTFMRNKFGWDKERLEEVSKCAADRILEKMRESTLEKAKHYEREKSS